MKLNEPMKNKEKLIRNSSYPIIASLCLNFLEKSNIRTKHSTENRKKGYSSLWGASNDGIKCSVLQSIIENSIEDSLRTCVGSLSPTDDNEKYIRSQFLSRYVDNVGLDF